MEGGRTMGSLSMCVTLMELEKFLSKAEYMSVILIKSPSLCREHRGAYVRWRSAKIA